MLLRSCSLCKKVRLIFAKSGGLFQTIPQIVVW
jgi:hypothetical protein